MVTSRSALNLADLGVILACTYADNAQDFILLRIDTLITDGIVDCLDISNPEVLDWAAAFMEGR